MVGLSALTVWAVVSPAAQPGDAPSGPSDSSDIDLYRAIVNRMIDGASYYQAVGVEQSARNYPVSPAPAVREPTLAWLISTLGSGLSYALLVLLAACAVVLAVQVFDRLKISRGEWMLASLVAALATATLCVPSGVWFHDVWAGVLLLLGVMAHMSGRWRLAVGAILAAALIRELAAPVIVLAAVLAWRRGHRAEAVAWAVAGGAFAAFYTWHVIQVSGLLAGSSGPGWFAGGGWPFSVETIRFSSLLRVGRPEIAAVVVSAALLGWALIRVDGPLLIGTIGCYLGVFMIIGRPDNAYWGALLAPLVLPGVVLAPRGVAQWVRLARSN